MSSFPSRLVWSCALLISVGCSSSDDNKDDDTPDAGPTDTLDAGAGDASAIIDAAPTRDAARDAAPAPADAAVADAAVDSGLVFVPGNYGPCPAPLSCDPFIYFIANDLIRKEYFDAPSNVSACVQPNLPFPAVPACYAPGACRINKEAGNIDVGFEVGICLGMQGNTVGYCLKPCT